MDHLQNKFQATIKKFQDKAVELARQESEEQIAHLKKKLKYQSDILNELKKAYDKIKFELEAEEKGGEAALQFESTNHEVTVCASVSDEKVNLNEPASCSHAVYLEAPDLHSIKDRVKHMGYNPENFSNTDLAHIGRQMSAYYRKTYNGRSPEKKEEKINDKHNSSVCAYAKVDWPYMDKLIKTNLDPLHRWWGSDEKENFEKHTGAETEVHSIKDRLKHMNQDLQRFDNKDLCSIGKKMVTYYRKMNKGEDPPKKDERINDKHNSLVCAYSETDWEYLDYLITTNLKI
jgi:hypothetical protein